MYLNPDRMTSQARQRVDRWLQVNGCRHHVALDPIVVRGNVAEYVAISRRDDRSIERQIVGGGLVELGRKRLRIRVPLSRVS